MTPYQEQAVLIMHFELGMHVGTIADEFTRPCDLFGRLYDPIYIDQGAIEYVINCEKLKPQKKPNIEVKIVSRVPNMIREGVKTRTSLIFAMLDEGLCTRPEQAGEYLDLLEKMGKIHVDISRANAYIVFG